MANSSRLSAYLQKLQRFGIAPGLDRIRALLERAGNPQQSYPIVLVGGTNGKGSTCEFLARLLAADGLEVGLYTSPHLYEWNERIRILLTAATGRPAEKGSSVAGLFPGSISEAHLDALFDAGRPHIEAVAATELGHPTEFEVLTFLGFWHFARQAVDLAVVEVGLGGRWDATNISEPQVSVITHVALDHCDRLGSTLEAIAADKVEITRPGRVLVTAETKPEVLRVFEQHCQAIGCSLQKVDAARSGDFQERNLATAQTARRVLADALHWPLRIDTGNCPPPASVPARFETVRRHPQLILDGANNPDGASTLAGQLQSTLAAAPEAKLILVLGILQDKDWAEMTRILTPLAEAVIVTQSNSPRAASAGLIADRARKYCAHVETILPVQDAVKRALEVASKTDIICVTGSFYTVAEVDRQEIAGGLSN